MLLAAQDYIRCKYNLILGSAAVVLTKNNKVSTTRARCVLTLNTQHQTCTSTYLVHTLYVRRTRTSTLFLLPQVHTRTRRTCVWCSVLQCVETSLITHTLNMVVLPCTSTMYYVHRARTTYYLCMYPAPTHCGLVAAHRQSVRPSVRLSVASPLLHYLTAPRPQLAALCERTTVAS